jgi:hypothetical protein
VSVLSTEFDDSLTFEVEVQPRGAMIHAKTLDGGLVATF